MRYGNDDQAGNAEVEAARKRSQRWIQLALKPKQKLIRHYMREMSKRGRVNLVGGPRTREEIANAIISMEREDEVATAHLAEYGAGHEQCPTLNFQPVCEAAKARKP